MALSEAPGLVYYTIIDTAWYAMTDADWPLLEPAFRRWLAADNFDADGR